MMVVMRIACWVSLVLLMCSSAPAMARIGHGMHTSASLEQTPQIPVHNSQQAPREVRPVFGIRRGLVGSSPPTCVGRCEACLPCKPVHVAITNPHPVISETDYYPEVWRCLCGNKYYMP